jgi:putative membrane protein
MIEALYPWIKALHVVAVIAWMAGLLYLPRLFVYHATAPVGSPLNETFKVMEAKLMRIIMMPAATVSWIMGVTMIAAHPTLLEQGWLWVKIAFVLALTGMHFTMVSWRRAFAEDRNRRTQRYFRVANELPTLALIIIVIMVIVRPF